MELDPVLHVRYMAWATATILDAVKQLSPEEYAKDRGSSYGGVKGTLEHIYRADMVWFSRLAGEPFAKITDVPVPDSFDELRREWASLHERMQRWVSLLAADQFGIEIRYSNSQGIPYSTPIWQVLMQVINHSSYHRGQVITMLRQAGVSSSIPSTDLISFYRLLQKQAAQAS